MTMPEALPYGIRDVKLTPYADAQGTVLGAESFDLPNMQTLSFAETEEFQELRGDDRIVTTRGNGAQVEWSLEAGGISPKVWSILSGGQVIESGTTPNRSITMRKRGSDSRPFFRIDGQSISDSGGDLRVRIYRCRVNDNIEGEFSDGEFFVTSASGLGLPLLDDTQDLLYDIVQNESKTQLTLTPEANPIPNPQNLTVGTVAATTVALSWDPVIGADSYVVEKATTPFTTWSTLAGTMTDESIAGTGLTAETAYKFRVKTVIDSVPSTGSEPTGIVTTPAA